MIGETLGRYRVVSRIGEGGMGVVYLAEHSLIGRRAAVKVLRDEMSSQKEHVTRFFNEARAVAGIHHPGLVDVYDYGHGAGGAAYIVMEMLDGESLAQRLARLGALPVDTALAIVRQIAGALQAAHDKWIVHRDLKPANIFLVPGATALGGVHVKVLDFGIAKLTRVQSGIDTDAGTGEAGADTSHGALFGTPRYMAPEQCKDASDVDGRADIYSLGCILFEMLVGRPPFVYNSWSELVSAHLRETPPRVRALATALPVELDALVGKALAKKPEDRFATMADFATAAERAASVARAVPVVESTAPIARDPSPTPTLTAELASPPRASRRGWMWFGATGVVVVAAAVSLAFAIPLDDDREPVAAAAPVPAPAPVPVPVPVPAPAPAPGTVHLLVDSAPRGAIVYRAADGVRLGITPLDRAYDRTDGTAEFVVKLAGYHDARVALTTREDGTTVAKLVRVATGRVRTGATKTGSAHTSKSTVLDPYGGK